MVSYQEIKGDRRRGEKCQEAEVQFHMGGQKEHSFLGRTHVNTDQKEVRLWALRVPVGGESQAIGTISQSGKQECAWYTRGSEGPCGWGRVRERLRRPWGLGKNSGVTIER